jgi:hypothetical protein
MSTPADRQHWEWEQAQRAKALRCAREVLGIVNPDVQDLLNLANWIILGDDRMDSLDSWQMPPYSGEQLAGLAVIAGRPVVDTDLPEGRDSADDADH